MGELNKLEIEYLSKRITEKLVRNNRYQQLAKDNVLLFKRIEGMLSNSKALLAYEENLSEMQSIAEEVAYSIGKYGA